METTIISILGWVGGLLGASLLGFVSWTVRKNLTQVENHEIRIERLEGSTVTADQVRSIIHQSNEPLLQTLADLKKDISVNTQTMNLVLQEIAERRGYEKAMKEIGGNK